MKYVILLLVLTGMLFSQEVIDISVKGISDNRKDGAQKDRMEAILDAKRQACEKAGMKIESKTTVENFQVVFDYIESSAESVLMPGFQMIDIGYVQDGTYQVVLTGKIQVVEGEEPISSKELRYAKSLKERGKHSQCEAILKKYIQDEKGEFSEEVRQEALYHLIKWGYSWNIEEDYQKFASFYPDSKRLSRLEKFAAFSAKEILAYNKSFTPAATQWQEINYIYEKDTFAAKIEVVRDTVNFKDFAKTDKTLIVSYELYSSGEKMDPLTAYGLKMIYFNDNIYDKPAGTVTPVKIEERFKVFSRGGSPAFQHSASGKWFGHFQMKYFQVKGDTPVGEGPFSQKISFKIYQRSF